MSLFIMVSNSPLKTIKRTSAVICLLSALFLGANALGQTCHPIRNFMANAYNCDNGATSVAAVTFGGTPPFTINITKHGTTLTQTFVDSTGSTYYITGLDPNATYDILATNICNGIENSVDTTVTAMDYPEFVRSDTTQPCLGQPYEFCVPVVHGATVAWTHEGLHMNKMGACYTTSSYQEIFDGEYTITVNYAGGCITRSMTFTLTGKDCEVPLPVYLASIQAIRENAAVILNWSTTAETHTARFEVERSINAKKWTSVGIQTASGESNSVVHYTFTDRTAPTITSYYRLKMIDSDNSFSYSRVVTAEATKTIQVFAYPNPVSERLFIDPSILKGAKDLSIVSLIGRMVYHPNSLPASWIDIRFLSPGIYLLKVVSATGLQSTQKILIDR